MAITAIADPSKDRNDKDIFTGLVQIGPHLCDASVHAASAQQAEEMLKSTYPNIFNVRAGWSNSHGGQN